MGLFDAAALGLVFFKKKDYSAQSPQHLTRVHRFDRAPSQSRLISQFRTTRGAASFASGIALSLSNEALGVAFAPSL